MELPSEAIERLLDTWPVARLATQGPEGPHQVPVVFVRVAGRIWSPIDGKPKRSLGEGEGELARVRNVRARPRVSLLLDGYDDDWDRLWWLRVDGDAQVVERDEPDVIAALRRKYPQYGDVPVQRGAPQLLAIEPGRVTSWCAVRGKHEG